MFDDCSTPKEVKDRWRQLANEHHPDKGGDAEYFDKVKKEYDKALEKASAPIKCPDCNGAGVIVMSKGWNSGSLRCKRCKGTGQIRRDE